MSNIKKQLRKYFIMDSQNCDRDPVEILNEAVTAGITAFQYREKGHAALTGHAKLELGKQLREICASHQIPFIVNDDIELVEPLDADGDRKSTRLNYSHVAVSYVLFCLN